MSRREAVHSVAGSSLTTPKELEMLPPHKAAIAVIAGAIIHAVGGIT
jgi:hypothetical protein